MSATPAHKATRLLAPLYNWGWKAVVPFLGRNKRLRQGLEQRTLRTPLPRADVWMQAASAGEAYLAVRICQELNALSSEGGASLSVLLTTYTSQGHDILQAATDDGTISARIAYCPFDAPSLMKKALEQARPKVVVLLETELWPGLLMACREQQTPVLVANGRMSSRSFSHYLAFSGLLNSMGPQRILAMSPDDAARFQLVFPGARTEAMPNIKFDNIAEVAARPAPDYTDNPVADAIAPKAPFVVFGSVRREEVGPVTQAVEELLQHRPRTIIGLFPRHMHHVPVWCAALERMGIKYDLRSKLDGRAPQGGVVVWDAFGELGAAYHLARAAFVGGSLASLGGQNFLEPLGAGLIPVTGPHWRNFAWVGREIVDQGLLIEAPTPDAVAEALAAQLSPRRKKSAVRKDFTTYIAARRGGAAQVAQTICQMAAASSRPA
ncbi:MAG: 3-deoxy-D-manno-octulosonic acid transferase [Desulfovibrio sp.]|uniref:3-deoxy-D-manno-octulosonic acid transferase n=1 Tax=Desulfovibrio sp. 7SRBS1 TaxID=3378064 RepID=UPI003B421931